VSDKVGQHPLSNIAILISGTGSNMQAIIKACESDELRARIAIVISNNPEAAGLQHAAAAGIATRCVNHRDYDSREVFDAALTSALQGHDIDLVLLAGFMRILTPVFIEPYLGQLLNIHPSLLPKYPGLHTHQRAIEAGDGAGGATVHFVTPELDSGPAIIQARVPIQPGDSAESLAARVIIEEHKIYPLAMQWFLQGRLRLGNQGVTLDGKVVPESGIEYS
jgi:phosphoribosylglycinamide formyltransferase-1